MKNFTNSFKKAIAQGSDFANSVKDKGSEIANIAKDLSMQQATQSISDVLDARRDGADNLMHTVTTKSGEISQANNLKGFIFEQEQARTFNEAATREESSLRAIVDPPGGADAKGAPDIRIVDTSTGETVKSYQAKIGNESYINQQIREDKYYDGRTDGFVIDVENSMNQDVKSIEALQRALDDADWDDPQSIDNLLENLNLNEGIFEIDAVITHDNISSEAFLHEDMAMIAENPEAHIQDLHQSADAEEITSGAVGGAAIAAIYHATHESIKILSKVYRGEDVPNDVILTALKDVMKVAVSGALRGSLIKIVKIILETQMEDSGSLPLVIISVTPVVYKTLLQYLQDEITLEECIKEVGAKSLSRAMIITVGIVIPPLGATLMGVSVLTAIWREFEVENQIRSNYPNGERIFELIKEAEAKKKYMISLAEEKLSQTKEAREKAIDSTKQKVRAASENLRGSINDTMHRLNNTTLTKKEITGETI